VRRVLNPEDERYRKAKFGKLREDGTIEAPNPLTLKWVLPYYFRVKEWQVTLCMFALTTFFCVIALFIPY
jgi:UDP-N-acetylglucosamine--dolichyl-phosphate N-acetylglucosaminephosphotransferase